MRQLMTESLIVAMAGGAAGLFVAYGGILLLQTLSVPSDPPNVLGVQLDWRVVRVQPARGAGELYLLRPGSGLADRADGLRERTEDGRRRRVRQAAHIRPRCSGGRPDRARDGGADRRRHVSRGLPEHAGDAARISHGPPDQPGYRARRAALLARTDQGLLPPAGRSRSHDGRRGGGGDDRGAAAVSRSDRGHGSARGVPVPEGPRKNDRVRRRRGRRLLQHPECRNQTRARLHGSTTAPDRAAWRL